MKYAQKMVKMVKHDMWRGFKLGKPFTMRFHGSSGHLVMHASTCNIHTRVCVPVFMYAGGRV
jgi:hypothetical protein